MGPSTMAEALYCSQCGALTPVENLANFGRIVVCPFCKDLYAQRLREGAIAAETPARYGGFWVRVVASLIDSIIVGTFNSILQLVVFGPLLSSIPTRPDPAAVTRTFGIVGLATLMSFATDGLYQSIFIAKMGATPGKMALGLKVLRPDGSRVGFWRAVGRYLCKILNMFTACVGFAMVGWDAEKRGLHDMICDTRVFKRRT